MTKKSIIAIMGPSGAGKTTLGQNLSERLEISIPRHCTTRSRRDDDQEGFYRFLNHEQYDKLLKQGKFLISSGDGPEVKKEYGNFYGVLLEDCISAWNTSNVIILFVSYKDIDALVELKNNGIEIDIVNLTFSNIEKGISDRLINNTERNHTSNDIKRRINCALEDTEKYGKALSLYAKTTVYTDILNIEQTYDRVCNDLKLSKEKKNEL